MMLERFRRIPIITLLALMLLMAACTASQAKLKWSISGGYGDLGWWITLDVHRVQSTDPLPVQGFGLNLMYPAGTYSGLELLGPYEPTPPTQIPSPSPTGGVLWVEGSARPGATLPGLDGNVDLARFHIDSFFDIFTELTVSGGYVDIMQSDGTTVRETDIDPVSGQFVPEPSSIAALLTGVAGLAGFGVRRRRTR